MSLVATSLYLLALMHAFSRFIESWAKINALSFDGEVRVFRDYIVASANIDRLVHHASIFYITGSSYRLKNKLKKVN